MLNALFVFGAVGAATRSSESGQSLPAPDLVPVTLARVQGGSLSAPSTPVTVRIVVKNDSRFDLVGQESRPARWTVQVQGHANQPHLIQRSLRAGEQYSFTLTVIVPCGKATPLEVWVNPARAVSESNYDNNRAKFAVDGNACPKVAAGAASH